MVYTYQQLAAPNDRNGNPRRLWVVCFQRDYDRPGQDVTNGALVATAVIT